jgi:hypothetical protein
LLPDEQLKEFDVKLAHDIGVIDRGHYAQVHQYAENLEVMST